MYYLHTEWITGYRHCVLVDAKQMSRHISGTSGQTWTTVNYMDRLLSGQIGFIIVLLYERLSISQLTVIFNLIVK